MALGLLVALEAEGQSWRKKPKTPTRTPTRAATATVTPTATQTPLPPQTAGVVTAFVRDDTSILLQWLPSTTEGPLIYQVERTRDPVNGPWIVAGETYESHFLDTGLMPETEYFYRVQVFRSVEGPPSNTVTATTNNTMGLLLVGGGATLLGWWIYRRRKR